MALYATRARGGQIEIWELSEPPQYVGGHWKHPGYREDVPKRYAPPRCKLPYEVFQQIWGDLEHEYFMRIA